MANFFTHRRTIRFVLKVTLGLLKLIFLILMILKKLSELS
jgi:hypothetical protein